jgi:hypothetical protein
MPREREYANAAERQEAYRARHRDREPIRQGYLASLARTLHGQLQETARAGRCPVPAELITRRADETLGNVIRYLTRLREAGDSDEKSPAKGGEKEAESR